MTARWNSAAAAARGRAAADPSLVPHGTRSGYAYWGCKCGACAEEARLAQATVRARRKQRLGLPLTDWDAEMLGPVTA